MKDIDDKFNPAFDIPLGKIKETIHRKIDGSLRGYKRVIPLKDISEVNHIAYFKEDIFHALIKKIPLRDTNIYPYADSVIKTFNRGSKGLEVGQTFVLKEKILSIMGAFSRGKGNLFEEFVSNGLSKMTPLQIYGVDREGNKAMAFYVPAIVEIHKDCAILLDGMHRATICDAGGTSIKAIHVQYIGATLPFEPIDWEDMRMVDVKPPIEERYVNLKPELFRDLGAVGIDG